MQRKKIIKTLLLGLLVVAPFSGCVTIAEGPLSSYYGINKRYAHYPPEQISRELSALEEQVKKDSGTYLQATLYLQMALLYVHHNNPERDYGRAEEALGHYMALEPEGAAVNELQNWIIALQEVKRVHLELETLKAQHAARRFGTATEEEQKLLSEENIILNQEIERLQSLVDKLRGDIEKLSQLDMTLEKKRKINR